MAKNLQTPSPAPVIKWTDEEWELIAKQLHTTMGSVVSSSRDLSEVKAKDVFLAQESALPEHRHRKLISISQGFESVRQRLKPMLQSAASATQKELFEAQSHRTGVKAASQEKAKKIDKHNATPAPIVESTDIAHSSRAAAAPTAHPISATDTNASKASDQANRVEAVHASSTPRVPAAATEESSQMAAGTDRRVEHQRTQHDPRPTGQVPKQDPAVRNVRLTEKSPSAAIVDFNEIVRPFIAMVCQEFVQALVNVASRPENINAVATLLGQAMPRAGNMERNTGSVSHPRSRENAQHQLNPRPAPPQSLKDTDPTSNRHQPSTADDDDGEMDNDVQPLFDPKLPPSANSSFKPVVGVVGASPRDFSDLQQMYPQLMLTAIAVDDVPHAGALEQCQRVIGLREDVPAKTDEILRQSFRNRYLRLTGGMARVREQLDVWLDKPGGSGQPRPRFNKPHNNKGAAKGPNKRPGKFTRTPR
ncbi:hypothetical protein [Noviherbaspirillum saxi]|uniref:Uncharacterized protein n=1 Tax=Noviherbaspirillum saxi TaxID=2320863 RepID=A0A3A3FIS9_9BURK|nr:hypothetical protein [Noviherbaspirillum saxi]RJF92298.1 hypothetical protein D3871_27115 [Noviherbaspirillum saxi]